MVGVADKKCILCGNCLAVCPLLAATGREELGPRAKADLYALAHDDAEVLSEKDVARLTELCLGCGRCKSVCSQGVDVPGLVAALRAAHPDFKGWLWKTWLTRAKTLWGASSAAAKCIPPQFQPEKLGPFLKMLAGLKGGPGLTPFLTPRAFPDTYQGESMLLFAGCTANFVQGRWLMSALRLLDGLGVNVLPGKFQCCGGGLVSAGFAAEAQSMAAYNVTIWRKAGRPRVVVFCSSCLSGLAEYTASCFDDAAEMEQWNKSLLPLSEIAHDISFVKSDNMPKTCGCHRPCHADKADSDYRFLKTALGDRLVTTTDKQCCGFGGVMRLGTPELSQVVNQDCWVKLGTPEIVLTGCSACAAQLDATAPEGVAVGHWLEVV